jgi:hypothetical protein
MSTFTTIRTCIKDVDAMYCALQAIPGARVLRDVLVPGGVGKAAQIPFVVQMAGAQASGFWGTITKSVRYFVVVKEADGTLSVKIDQDQGTHRAIADAAQKAIGSAEAAATAEDSRIHEQRRQEVLRQREALAAKQQHDRDVRAREVSDSYSSARAVLARLDEQRARQAVETETAVPATPPSDPGGQFQAAILRNVTQEYAKQKVLEQLDEIQAEYGVSLGDIQTLEDGTIELTLKG